MENIQRLPKVIKLKGIGIPGLTMTEIKSDGKVRMYKRADNVYEIGIVKTAKAGELFGKSYPDREVIWNSEDFGVRVKSKNSFEGAEEAFKMFQVVAKDKEYE